MAKEITDFGEKIGGARKDIAEFRKNGGFSVDVVKEWSDADREKYITKKEVFPVPDFQKMYDEQDYDREALFYIKKVRDALPAQPCYDFAKAVYRRSGNNDDMLKTEIALAQEQYITALNTIQEKLMAVESMFDIKQCGEELYQAFLHDDIEVTRCFNQTALNKTVRAATMSSYKLNNDLKKAEFLYSPEEALLKSIEILKYNGENVKREINGLYGEDYMTIKQSGSTYYLYREDEKIKDMDKWKTDTYFVRREHIYSNAIIGINFNTFEEAKAFALEYMKDVNEKQAIQKKNNDKERKTRLTPPELAHITRIGEDFRDGHNVSGDDMMKTFEFRGGEFGNWENQIDRQANLNMSFEAFKDLSKALDMSDKDVSLGGNLAIAYGARGRGNALAHYEAGANVINLTKIRGAGSLGHEWGHALDAYIARETGVASVYATDSRNAITEDVVKAMKYTTNSDGMTVKTQYFQDAIKIDLLHSKSDKGYWQSNVELFARAFSTYVMDKLSPNRSDYLCGHAEFAPVYFEDNLYYTYPRGEERIAINNAFDKLFEELKERGLINERQPENEHKLIHQQDGVDINKQQENKEQITEALKNNDSPEITDWSQLSFDFDETSAESVEPVEQTESIEQETIEQPNESIEAETESRQNSFQSSVVALLNEAVNDNFPEMDENARERIQEMIKNTALQLSLAVNDELNNDKIAEFARTAYSPISFENVPVQDIDGMEYNVGLAGKDFYEALGRAVEYSEDLKHLVDKAGGVTAFRTNENNSIGFSAVKDDFIEDEIYFSCEVNSNKTTLSIPIPLDIDETKALIGKIDELEEKTINPEKKRIAAERDI